MTIWRPERGALKRPAYRSLAQSLIGAIESGELQPGDRLPTHRELAFDLGLSVQTISRAYEELVRLDIVTGEVGRGTFVRAGPVETRTPYHRLGGDEDVIDCSMLTPVIGAIHSTRMSATMAELAQAAPEGALFSFRPGQTMRPHRDSGARWLARCGVDAQPDRILPTNGATAAMTVALMTAASPGDLVLSEEIGHHTLRPLARYLGLRIGALASDEDGIAPDSFAHACAANPVKAIYVMPNGLNPTATTMSADRRAALVEIARAHDILIVENDAWGPLQPERPRPIAALAPERTLYFTGFSKCLLPGLRAAYLVAPEALVAAATNRHLVTNWMATPLMFEIASSWIADGTAAALLRWQQRALGRRNRIAAEMLEGLPFRASPNGLHVWTPLPEGWSEGAFVAHARLNGVAVAAGSAFAISDRAASAGVRICLGGPAEAALRRGLETVAELLRGEPDPGIPVI
ncbi:PLP-dependent aminotransferase family protein [Pikeienuella piscinae]|uniref:PLP-dependent aminotransferase family protein n=1 Tax=Pikeienuella piscinae TaxID=2748098 RepID=A0A7L5BUH7_9RHOB|nr:PLP-dependent aminotransferase family protein [Pikeienuella piscinae]QIE55465.1 PLP-dependent aminotransferase family protein [Pikeienuella piscinae]